MPDEHGAVTMTPSPDPTILTREASEHAKEAADKVDQLRDEALQREFKLRQDQRESEVANLKKLLEVSTENLTQQLNAISHEGKELTLGRIDLFNEKIASIRREIIIYETHRLELKSDSEKTLSTATIAAEKAVQAALAAAEKARDQQTIASQLATSKAEDNSKEQLKQQGETFSTAISSLNTGLNDVKSLLGELRAEKRGSTESNTERRASSANWGLWVGVAVALFMGINGLLLTIIGIVATFVFVK